MKNLARNPGSGHKRRDLNIIAVPHGSPDAKKLLKKRELGHLELLPKVSPTAFGSTRTTGATKPLEVHVKGCLRALGVPRARGKSGVIVAASSHRAACPRDKPPSTVESTHRPSPVAEPRVHSKSRSRHAQELAPRETLAFSPGMPA